MTSPSSGYIESKVNWFWEIFQEDVHFWSVLGGVPEGNNVVFSARRNASKENHIQIYNLDNHGLKTLVWDDRSEDIPDAFQHVDCNLKTECEDGRDETEHCSFSSPKCQGLVALCDRCYKFVSNMHGFYNNTRNMKKNS
ncbi:hypothetical protein ACOMHN_039636 [Nucella lapillus]